MHREVNWPKSDKPCLPTGKSSHVEQERRPKMDMEKNRPNSNIFRLQQIEMTSTRTPIAINSMQVNSRVTKAKGWVSTKQHEMTQHLVHRVNATLATKKGRNRGRSVLDWPGMQITTT
jgi:hypothetical protein